MSVPDVCCTSNLLSVRLRLACVSHVGARCIPAVPCTAGSGLPDKRVCAPLASWSLALTIDQSGDPALTGLWQGDLSRPRSQQGGLAGINQSTLIRTAHALVSLHDDQWMSHSTWWFLTMIVVPNGAFSSNTARPAPRLRHSLLTRPNRLCLPPSHPPSAAAVMADPAQKLGCPHSQEPHLQTLCGPKAMPAALGVPRPCLPPWAS